MSTPDPPTKPPSNTGKRLVGSLVYSRAGRTLARLPGIAWIIRSLSRELVQRQIFAEALPGLREPSVDLESSLRGIAYDVVEALGYAGAMVATYEPGDVLPVRAVYVDPELASAERIQAWLDEISAFSPRPLNLTDPNIARLHVHDPAYQDNLGARAAKERQPVISDNLFDLFTPIAPKGARSTIEGIQQALGIQQVIAVPFFIETRPASELSEQPTKKEYVGNLSAARRAPISAADVRVLSAFARQMAAAIRSERRRLRASLIQQLILDIQRGLTDEEQILNRIVQGVVSDMGYLGAMVATYEPGDVLPVRALHVDPQVASMERIQAWLDEVSAFSPQPLSLTDPNIARVYVHHPDYQGNLSTKAAKERRPVVSDSLFDLFTPIAPEASRSAVEGIQQALGVQQVIAAPFFTETYRGGRVEREFVGNLFAATRAQEFQSWEIELLGSFGQQAAAGLKNARQYRQSDSRRVTAEVFGKMAFSATAALHAFRNHIGVIRLNMQLIDLMRDENGLPDCKEWDQHIPSILERLDRIKDILDSLHEPFKPIQDVPVSVNTSLRRALDRAGVPEAQAKLSLADDLPAIRTMPEMLITAFQIILKNAVEAIQEKEAAGQMEKGGSPALYVESSLSPDAHIEVLVRDQGIGIRPDKLSQVFELGSSTKEAGMGFGLFWVRDYILGLGGSIHLESRWGQGTSVRIRLPVPMETEETPGESNP